MALITKGSPALTLQPGWEVIEAEDDTLRATLTYDGPYASRNVAPRRGSAFPFGDPMICHERRVQSTRQLKCRVTCEFIGIRQDPTPFRVEFPGGSGSEPIETHPNFTTFAGTPSAPNNNNGAVFDPETDEFLGFTAGSLRGIRSYLVPNVLVNLSYWTWRVPQPRRIAREIVSGIPGVLTPAGVKNFLLIGLPYRQVGNLFAVTEQYMGSGENGWNLTVYN